MGVTLLVPKIYKYDFILLIARALQERCDIIGEHWYDRTPIFEPPCLYNGSNVCALVYQKFYYNVVRLLEDGGWYYYQLGLFKTVTVLYVCSLLGFLIPPNPPIVGLILHRLKYMDFLKFICTAISCMNMRRRRSLDFSDLCVNIKRESSERNYYEWDLLLRYKVIADANKRQSYKSYLHDLFPIYWAYYNLLDSYRKAYSPNQLKYYLDGMSNFYISALFVVADPLESYPHRYLFNKTAYPVNFLGYVLRQYTHGWNLIEHPLLCFKELPPPLLAVNKTAIYVSLWADWVTSNCVKISDDLYVYETVSVESKLSFKRMWEAFTDRPTQITRDDLLPNLSTANYNALKCAEVYLDSSYPEYPLYRGKFDIHCVVGGLYKPRYVKFHFQHNPTI